MAAISPAPETAHSATPHSRRTPSLRPTQAPDATNHPSQARRDGPDNSPGREPKDPNPHRHSFSLKRAIQPPNSAHRSRNSPDRPAQPGHPWRQGHARPSAGSVKSRQILSDPAKSGPVREVHKQTQSLPEQTNPWSAKVTTNPIHRGTAPTRRPADFRRDPARYRPSRLLGC